MSIGSAAPGRGFDPALRKEFVRQLSGACAALSVDIFWNEDAWIAELCKGSRRTQVVGYAFELNSSAVARLSIDKAATSERLAAHAVPVIPHRAITVDQGSARAGSELFVSASGYPVVIKPIDGYDGHGVVLVRTESEFIEYLQFLAVEQTTIVVAPYVDAATEYRVIVLDGQILLVYRKLLNGVGESAAEWRFNAEFGSIAEVVDAGITQWSVLTDIARRTASVMGLRVGAVDILESVTGELSVVEVNEDFSTNYFGRQSRQYSDLMVDVFTRIVAASLNLPDI
ncbi:hypothetical protein AB0G00_32610 [Nocardia salmonicida]|uniref:ATP-grasp domain-containing protein n=1 Tax=Nocardia salmonicida TaxID=53431 RepID=UPI0034093C00